MTFNHQGLTEQQATELLKQHGPNCHARKKRKTFLQKFFAQFADLMIADLDKTFVIDPQKFVSKGKNSPFGGYKLNGVVKYTIVDGEIKYQA